jgi:lipid-A-disaccharide synthase
MGRERSQPLIALVAGEASGDLLGADLIRALRLRYPEARFVGVGGPQMRNEGFEAWWDCSELAVMGLAEVLRHLPRLLKLRRQLRARLLEQKPDVFVGIDAPDFNLGLERRLKQAGLRTVHYVSPSVWAWRRKRAAKIGQSADRVLCLFPMEPPIYAEYGVEARFIGHPLAEQYPLPHERAAARAALGIEAEAQVLALLPGSRLGEIGRIGADFIATAARLQRARPQLQILAPMANAACRSAFEAQLQAFPQAPRVRLLDAQSALALRAADAVLLASGTAALEALLAGTPMVVGYRISALTHWIVNTLGLLKVSQYSLPNALAGHRLVPECMQDDCRPEQLEAALTPLLDSPEAARTQTREFARIHAELRRGASTRAASAVAELLDGQ